MTFVRFYFACTQVEGYVASPEEWFGLIRSFRPFHLPNAAALMDAAFAESGTAQIVMGKTVAQPGFTPMFTVPNFPPTEDRCTLAEWAKQHGMYECMSQEE